jgi:hypothetical protein
MLEPAFASLAQLVHTIDQLTAPVSDDRLRNRITEAHGLAYAPPGVDPAGATSSSTPQSRVPLHNTSSPGLTDVTAAADTDWQTRWLDAWGKTQQAWQRIADVLDHTRITRGWTMPHAHQPNPHQVVVHLHAIAGAAHQLRRHHDRWIHDAELCAGVHAAADLVDRVARLLPDMRPADRPRPRVCKREHTDRDGNVLHVEGCGQWRVDRDRGLLCPRCRKRKSRARAAAATNP